MKKSMRRVVVVLIAAILIGVMLWLVVYWNEANRRSLTVTNAGPLDIRLWGIRPNAGDIIYDPNGRKIQETLGIAQSGDQYWGEEFQRFDFIFELPDDESMRFVSLPEIEVGDVGKHLGGSFKQVFFDYAGRRLLWLRATIPRTFERSVLHGLWVSDTKVDAVDITLEYYHGSVDSPGFVLHGPFEPNSTVISADEVLELSFSEWTTRRGDKHVYVTFRGPESWNLREPLIIYDTSGNRDSVIARHTMGVRPGGRIEFLVQDMALGQISAIAFGQSPRYIIFKNVNLDVAGRKRRAYPAYYDEIAERLQSPVTGEGLTQHNFRSAAEALKVIEIVRGQNILRAVEATLYRQSRDTLDLQDLTEEQTSRLRQTLRRWVTAMDPQIRVFAVEAGLLLKWPEFVDPALELLECPVRRAYESTRGAQFRAAAALEQYADELSEAQERRIEALLVDENRKRMHSSLMRLLENRAEAD